MEEKVKNTTNKCNDKPTNFNFYKLLNKINKHVGLIAIVIPLLAGLVTFILKFAFYRYAEGYLSVFNINYSYINNDRMYTILTSLSFIIFILICTFLIKVNSINTKHKIRYFINLFFGLFLLNFSVVLVMYGSLSIVNFIMSFISAILLIILQCFLYFFVFKGIIILFSNEKNNNVNKKHNYKLLRILIFISFTLIVLSYMPYYQGKKDSKTTKNFKIISDKKIIVYETNNRYFLQEYIETDSGNTIYINSNIQKEINKTDVSLTIKSYKHVEIDPDFKKYDELSK